MMKNIISFVCLLALFVSGCGQEEIAKNNASSSRGRVFTTSFEQDGSRTYLEGGTSSRWTVDDRISVFDGNTLNLQYEFQGETGDVAGDFYMVGKPEGTGSSLTTNYAVYPYSENVQITTGGVITTTLPANQHYAENSFGLGDNTMVAVTQDAESTSLAFKNVCGCLNLKLYGTDVTVKSITLVGNNEEKIAGTAAITAVFGEAPVVSMADDATGTITLDCGEEGVRIGASAEVATAFWMVVPPTTFAKGFTLTVKDLNNKVFTLTTDQEITIARNVVKQVVPKEVVMEDSQTLACSLPRGEVFRDSIISHYESLGFQYQDGLGMKGIKFMASSTPSDMSFPIDCEGEDAYLEKVEDSLYIHTAASEFVFNEDCCYMFSCKSIETPIFREVTKIDFNKCVNTGSVTNMNEMFSGCSSLASLDLSSFDTGNVTDMGYMFHGCISLTSLNLSTFDTGNVTTAAFMFSQCRSLLSLDLSGFDTGRITDMQAMFSGCESLSSLGLSAFDTHNVTNMIAMFTGCSNLSSLDLSNFDTSNVTTMASMFASCYKLSSLDLRNFDTGNVTDMRAMFWRCSFTTLDLSSFDTGNVTDMSSMFDSCSSLSSLDLSTFDTGNVTDMSGMFDSCSSLSSLDLSTFDTGNVTNMQAMFSSCRSLPSLDLSNFDTSNVTTMASMFTGCSNLSTLDLSSFDTGSVTNMNEMFSDCRSLVSLDLSSFDTSNVTDMSWMFFYCSSLTSLNLSSFDTGNVTDMSCMFAYCNLSTLDLSSFDTGNVTNMLSMFYYCSSLVSLDLSSFDTGNVSDMKQMFYYCSSLVSLDLSSFETSNVTDMSWMFLFVGYDLTDSKTQIRVPSPNPFAGYDELTQRDLNKTEFVNK